MDKKKLEPVTESKLQMIFGIVMALLAGGAGVFGYVQNRKYKKEREEKVDALLKSVEKEHEEKTSKLANQSNAESVADANKQYGPARPLDNRPKSK